MYFASFWAWYERHYRLNITIAAGLFVLQIIHLYWLSVEVVLARLIALSGFWPEYAWLELIIIFVDYTEIPALITTSLVYINELRHGLPRACRPKRWRRLEAPPDGGAKWGSRLKPLLYLLMLNSQWLHLFWITDEFVIAHFIQGGEGTILPHWLAWVAIGIDYLEVPVIIDLFIKLARDLARGNLHAAAEELRDQ